MLLEKYGKRLLIKLRMTSYHLCYLQENSIRNEGLHNFVTNCSQRLYSEHSLNL